jgi:hypothetical protein
MRWEFQTISVFRRYRHRERDYTWVTDEPRMVGGWEEVLATQAEAGWELVSACVESSEINNTRTETSGYRLFFRRPTPR